VFGFQTVFEGIKRFMFELGFMNLLELFNAFIFTFGVQYLNSQNKRIDLKDFLKFTLLFFIIIFLISDLTIMYRMLIVSTSLPLLIHFFYRFNIVHSIITTFIVYFLAIIGEILTTVMFVNVLGFTNSDVTDNVFILASVFFFVWLFMFIISLLKKYTSKYILKITLPTLGPTVLIVSYFVFTILIASINAVMYGALVTLGKSIMITFNVVIFAFYLTISLFMFYLYSSLKKQKFELDVKQKEYDQLKVYTGIIEDLLEDLREYKHDAANIILTLNGFLESNNIEQLKNYFYKDIMKEHQKVFQNDTSSFATLQNIVEPGLKGLLATKLSYAHNLKLNVNFSVLDFSDEIEIEMFDLYKIMGILIDNAIEASIESSKKDLTLFIMKDTEETTIIIGNSFKSKPSIKEIFKKGYSTKGKDRGLGLNIVKNILDIKYDNVILNTFVQDDSLIQELIIANKK